MRLGLSYRVLGQYETAVEYFQRASALDPKDTAPLLSIARTYFQTGEYQRAAQYIETALELEPTNPDIYGRLGLVEFKALNYEGAVTDLGCAIDGCTHPLTAAVVSGMPLKPETLEYYYTFGSVLAAYLKCDRALPVFSQVAAFAADDEVVQNIVAEGRAICEQGGTPSVETNTAEPNKTPAANKTAMPVASETPQPAATFTPTPGY